VRQACTKEGKRFIFSFISFFLPSFLGGKNLLGVVAINKQKGNRLRILRKSIKKGKKKISHAEKKHEKSFFFIPFRFLPSFIFCLVKTSLVLVAILRIIIWKAI
jgi:hypothetical protein